MKDRGAANRTQLHVYLRCSSMCFAPMAAGVCGIAARACLLWSEMR